MGVKTYSRIFAAVVICALSPARAAEGSVPLSHADLVKQATQQSGAQHAIARLPDGDARIPSPMQALEAVAGREGITVRSTARKEPGNFTLRAVELGRAGGPGAPIGAGSVQVEKESVQIRHPDVTEELTTSADGVRQDFVLNRAPAGQGELRLTLAARGAKVAKRGDAVSLTLSSGRELLYHDLKVVDSAGKVLPSHFDTVGQKVVIAVDDRGARYPVRIDPTITDADWISVVTRAIDGAVRTMVWTGKVLYLGGDFTVAPGGVAARHIARWNGSQWAALGDIGVNSNETVRAMAWDSTNQTLYVGGLFDSVDGHAVKNVAKWSGGGWSGLNAGTNGEVDALAWDGETATLYAGGRFTVADWSNAWGIAQFKDGLWAAVGPGLKLDDGSAGRVNALVWDSANHALYAGGYFTYADTTPVGFIGKWKDGAWSQVGTGSVNREVLALTSDGQNIYAAGMFDNTVAKWDGTTLSALGGGPGSTAYALAWDGTNLHASWGDMNGFHVSRWKDGAWSPLGEAAGNMIVALVSDGTSLYAGGTIGMPGKSASVLTRWNEQKGAWLPVDKGVNGDINAFAWDGKRLYAAGGFSHLGGVFASNIAMWDGSTWSALGSGTDGSINALAWDGTHLYAGGLFSNAGGVTTNCVARWNGRTWSALGSGMGPTGEILVSGMGLTGENLVSGRGLPAFVTSFSLHGGNLYAGGNFTTAGDIPVNNIAMWNGSGWSPVGDGVDGPVMALVWGGNNLYAGGEFTNAIAAWNGTAWSSPGHGITSSDSSVVANVAALAWDGTNLYAGGEFDTAGTASAGNLAKWDGTTWSSIGSIVGAYAGYVRALALDGKTLYVGGRFTHAGATQVNDTAGAIHANNVAKWDGTTWSALGSGTDDEVSTLAQAGDYVYFSGAFNSAGGKSAAVAAIKTRTSTNGGSGSGGGGALGWAFLIGLGLLARRRLWA